MDIEKLPGEPMPDLEGVSLENLKQENCLGSLFASWMDIGRSARGANACSKKRISGVFTTGASTRTER